MATERLFREIVNIVSEATGENAAFSSEYGMSTLNEIRTALGLGRIDEAAMRLVLDGAES